MIRTLCLFLFITAWTGVWTGVQSCAVTKQQLWQCILKHADRNSNTMLEDSEIRRLVRDNTYWYERLVKSPDSVVRQIHDHCGLPLTYANMLKSSCFRHCGGLDGKRTVYNRICK